MIKILVDTHTHTNCSTHAYSTLAENMAEAKKRGMEMVCMTNHGPALPDGAHLMHFHNLKCLPEVIDGIKAIYGAEANLIDHDGNIDLPADVQKKMGIIIASIHSLCYQRASRAEHTRTFLGAIKNPYITIIGHSGRGGFDYDIDAVAVAAKEYGKCIEINSLTIPRSEGESVRCREIALACKRHGTNIVVASDAHCAYSVGVFDHAVEMLTDIDFPEELIMNTTAERFENYLNKLKSGR